MVLAILSAYANRICHQLNQVWKQDHDQKVPNHKGDKDHLS